MWKLIVFPSWCSHNVAVVTYENHVGQKLVVCGFVDIIIYFM